MLFEFSIYFFIFCCLITFFILASARTEDMNPDDAERLDILHDFLVLKVLPPTLVIIGILIPTIIVAGV